MHPSPPPGQIAVEHSVEQATVGHHHGTAPLSETRRQLFDGEECPQFGVVETLARHSQGEIAIQHRVSGQSVVGG